MKRVFGIFEAVLDIFYLLAAVTIGFILLFTGAANNARVVAGVMALILACGDAFHLLPRIIVIFTHKEEELRPALGLGKKITSITMTVFYLLLWQLGLLLFSLNNISFWSYLVYVLVAVRIALCLLPQNKWKERYPPVKWGAFRNIPFFILGIVVAALFFIQKNTIPGFGFMWLAIILSFAFYLPVVLWANKNPKIGMLMLPKACVYIWMLAMCLYI